MSIGLILIYIYGWDEWRVSLLDVTFTREGRDGFSGALFAMGLTEDTFLIDILFYKIGFEGV